MTNAEARFNNSLRPRKPEGSLGRTAQDGHLDSHTAPELSAAKSDENITVEGERSIKETFSPTFLFIDDRLYSAILRSLELTHCARMWFYMSD